MEIKLTAPDLSKIEDNIKNNNYVELDKSTTNNLVKEYFYTINNDLFKRAFWNTQANTDRIKAIKTSINSTIDKTNKLNVSTDCYLLLCDNENVTLTKCDFINYKTKELLDYDNISINWTLGDE